MNRAGHFEVVREPARPGGADGDRAVAVLDTLELRWFAAGALPDEVVDWFTDRGRVGPTDERCDTYRRHGGVDTCVKLRSQHTLELKSRRGIIEPIALSAGLVGAPELWRRWSPAGHLVDLTEECEWIDVSKTIFKRRFTPDGDETMPLAAFPSSGGCDVEVVAIGLGDIDAWSVALAAFGRAGTQRSSLITAWRSVEADAGPPRGFATSLATCAGYAAWLASLAATGDA